MKIIINGHTYDWNFVEGLYLNEQEWGVHNAMKLTIDIDGDLKQSVAGECTMHEIIEALNFWQNWQLEHHLLTQISASLYGTLLDNPIVLDTIFKREN